MSSPEVMGVLHAMHLNVFTLNRMMPVPVEGVGFCSHGSHGGGGVQTTTHTHTHTSRRNQQVHARPKAKRQTQESTNT